MTYEEKPQLTLKKQEKDKTSSNQPARNRARWKYEQTGRVLQIFEWKRKMHLSYKEGETELCHIEETNTWIFLLKQKLQWTKLQSGCKY